MLLDNKVIKVQALITLPPLEFKRDIAFYLTKNSV